MSVKSGQAIVAVYTTHDTDGALVDADALPVGTLRVNGTANAAVVTVANITTGIYKASLTLPTLAAGDQVALQVAATIGGVVTGGVVWQETADTSRPSDVATTIGAAGAGLTALGDTRLANLDAAVSTRSTVTTAQVNAECDTAIADAGLTAGGISDAVWDEALAGHAGAGTAGKALSDAGGAADPLLNAVPGAYTSGTAGFALGRIGSGAIVTTSTVAQGGDIPQVLEGADYNNTDGLAFDWTEASADAWPTLTGASITFEAVSEDSVTFSAAGSVVTGTGTKKVRLELTAAQTTAWAALGTGAWHFVIWATLASARTVALVTGTAHVYDTAGP